MYSPPLLLQYGTFLSSTSSPRIVSAPVLSCSPICLIEAIHTQNSATMHSVLQILLHTCRNSVEVSEAVAHGEGRTRALTQLLAASPPLPFVDQSMLLLLLGAILAQVPWAAELYVTCNHTHPQSNTRNKDYNADGSRRHNQVDIGTRPAGVVVCDLHGCNAPCSAWHEREGFP
jgi:hypothetical protein